MDSLTYWTAYYRSHQAHGEHSLFSAFVRSFLKEGSKILELGCGNGRDAVFFAKEGMYVSAIDQVSEEMDYLERTVGHDHLRFITGDFTYAHEITQLTPPYDCIYSRFTWHSIDDEQESRLLSVIPDLLADNGILAIETRGHKNSLFKKGQVCGGGGQLWLYL